MEKKTLRSKDLTLGGENGNHNKINKPYLFVASPDITCGVIELLWFVGHHGSWLLSHPNAYFPSLKPN